jgi:hypothetical protein
VVCLADAGVVRLAEERGFGEWLPFSVFGVFKRGLMMP